MAIMELPKSKQAKAMNLFKELQEEFYKWNYDQGRMDKLERQLLGMLNQD